MNFIESNYQRRKMSVYQPIPGYWYSNIIGHLQQVRVVLYAGARQTRVVIENTSGQRRSVSLADWYRLDLALHSPGTDRRRRRERKDSTETSP